MRKNAIKLGLVAASLATNGSLKAEELFKFHDKSYKTEDLDIKNQQRLYEIQVEAYRAKTAVIDNMAVELYLGELAKKENKSVDQLRDQKLAVAEPSESDLKKFYEENKHRIPYPYDQVKEKIVQFQKDKARGEKFEALLGEIKANKSVKFETVIKEPTAPHIDLSIAGFPSKGNPSAKVTVVEFADYRCPHCRDAHGVLQEAFKKYSNKINFVFVDFPIIADSNKIAEGAFCAKKGGKFWEYHDYAYENQGKFEKPDDVAKEIKLDSATFQSCMSSGEGKAAVEAGRKEGERVGVTGTPTIYINGYRYSSGYEKEMMLKAIEEAIAGKKYSS